ncbi:MAG: 30S ribosomal protein S8 [Eubacteriales bacterium]|nr:30S ribosomal protein S8 [Clostridia bacterium]MDY2695995.1 30S ribosomal protein S8 [Eubacteriales bacterium]
MVFTDPIADMLTRIRNGLTAHLKEVSVPASKEKLAIANILLKEGYIAGCDEVEENGHKKMNITLKYDENGESVIQGIKRISKPGLRVYAQKDKLPQVISGLGIAIVSTNKGLLTDKQARAAGVGGEVLAFVW